MLVGMPLLSAALAHDAWPNTSVSAASPEYDTAGESRGESVQEEREEEVESKLHLLAARTAGEALDIRRGAAAEPHAMLNGAGLRLSIWSIRGPPSA